MGVRKERLGEKTKRLAGKRRSNEDGRGKAKKTLITDGEKRKNPQNGWPKGWPSSKQKKNFFTKLSGVNRSTT